MQYRYLAGIMSVVDSINANGRYYPKTVMRKEVQCYHRDYILTGKAFGTVDHPAYSSPSYPIIDPATASHQILALWWRGTALHGVVRLLDSEAGYKARGILVDTGRLGASTRCWSSLAIVNTHTASVHKDCKLITFDLTGQPASGEFLRPLPDPAPWMVSPSQMTQQWEPDRHQEIENEDGALLAAETHVHFWPLQIAPAVQA